MLDAQATREGIPQLKVVSASWMPGRVRVLRLAGPFLLFWLVAAGFQWWAGAFHAELGEEPDEAAHYVTGLMVGDYARSGAQLAPIKFAERYYLHYPRVAFGLWPPMYHLTLGGWMFAFGGSRASALAFQGLLAATLALLLFLAVRGRWGTAVAISMGLLLLSVTAVRVSTASVMADVEAALFTFGAALLYGRYLQTERMRDAALFGVAAAAAILIKYNGVALAGVPLIAAGLSGRWRLLRTRAFWVPAVVVAAVCAPWYVFNSGLVRYAAEPVPGIRDIGKAMAGNLWALAGLAGPLVLLAALLATALRLRRGALAPPDAALVALIASLWGFHSLAYPVVAARYLLAAVPCLLLLAGKGLEAAAMRLQVPRRAVPGVCVCAVVLACAAGGFGAYNKPVHGFADAAGQLLGGRATGAVYLVAADATGEGALVAEVAMRDERPHSTVLRSSKVLASSTEMGDDYRTLYRTPEEVLGFLEGAGVGALVVRPSQAIEHHRQLLYLLARYPERWRRMARFGPPAQPVDIFAFLPRPGAARRPIRIDMKHTLGRIIE